ncbi:DUF6233 domain-containing protein [Streptomyces albidoflavus]|uniref:Uncharacterized protein n=1 Tax=Streptomyces albidoflavus TaxID=1886 RepID=A0AB37X417_9ACTN|nr:MULTISPECIES: DUF6233 domain-containing protein [Streptomyces]MBT2876439.1 hypothetical protein [Streptomyces sp. McG6]MBT2883039.1 hypothetical protein [Streptomyces sp. McG5]MBT2889252.1 hypothetical protein [Streptomyces sp. McG2]RZE30793.1 hypothetical protein C0Q91_31135 [Streptomyces albidoflavus]WSB18633.1 DUF6233 domain-containing protein [Streptomyces albidoflavus]
MSDLPADLPRLHVLRTWHAMWLARIDKAIATAEQREAETRRGAEVRPPPPAYVVQLGIGTGPPAAVHIGGCPVAGSRVRPLDTEQARQALVDVEACSMCRPDTDLGLL